MLLQTRKITPHNCFPKLLFKVATKNRVLKKFPPPKLLPQNWRFCKPVPQNSSQKPFYKAARCYRKLLSEVAFKAAPKSCSPKLLFKAIHRQICSGKLAKVVSQSYYPKLLPNVVVLQSCRAKLLLPKVAVLQFYRIKLLLKATPAPPSCSPKLLYKAVPQSHSPKLLSKAAPNSCSPLKLPLKMLPKATLPKFFLKFIFQSNYSSMLLQSCKLNCPPFFPIVVAQSCSPKLLPKAASQRSSTKQRVQAKEASTVCAVADRCNKNNISQRCGLEKGPQQ